MQAAKANNLSDTEFILLQKLSYLISSISQCPESAGQHVTLSN
jgi:hypothetical protein